MGRGWLAMQPSPFGRPMPRAGSPQHATSLTESFLLGFGRTICTRQQKVKKISGLIVGYDNSMFSFGGESPLLVNIYNITTHANV
jgi:hypothetical protein